MWIVLCRSELITCFVEHKTLFRACVFMLVFQGEGELIGQKIIKKMRKASDEIKL